MEDTPQLRIQARLRAWAVSRGLPVGTSGYLPDVESNLRQPLSAGARAAFAAGSGNELTDGDDGPAKMRALHSSSALVVNVFDFWGERDNAPLTAALGVPADLERIVFEQKLPTGLRGTPPNLDLLLVYRDSSVVAIESKFTEWMSPKPHRRSQFSPSYFPDGQGLWSRHGLERAQKLAEDMHKERRRFEYLDAAQLLKHVLGIAHTRFVGSVLMYLYYDDGSELGRQHSAEVGEFCDLVDARIGFRAETYQALYRRLASASPPEAREYLQYLEDRYFPELLRGDPPSD